MTDVNPGNVIHLVEDATVVLDGTDNFTTRYLLNDACIKLAKPWVYYRRHRLLRHDGHLRPRRGSRMAAGETHNDRLPALHIG